MGSKKGQTAAANAAWRRKGDRTAAARLRAAGWVVISPERARHILPSLLDQIRAIADSDA